MACDYTLMEFLDEHFDTALTCTGLVNIIGDVINQWSVDKPPKDQFKYDWEDNCPYTHQFVPPDRFDFGELIWSEFKPAGYKDPVVEPFGVVAYKDNIAHLVFRGTRFLEDLIMDTEDMLIPYPGPGSQPIPKDAKVCRGFWGVFDGMADTVIQQLKWVKQQGCKIIITGHSLGSAVATLAMVEAASLGLEVMLFNQASPMVGNSSFAAYCNDLNMPTYRLINTNDPVPKMPPEKEYRHIGKAVCFDVDYGGLKNHNPCCSYSYAICNPRDPFNPDFEACSEG
jgi:hypothetical protein